MGPRAEKNKYPRYSLCFIYFDVIIRQRPKKKIHATRTFFQSWNEIKTCGPVQQLVLGMLRDLILHSRDFQSLNGDNNLCRLCVMISIRKSFQHF